LGVNEINHFGKIAWQSAAECGKLCPLSAPYLHPGEPPPKPPHGKRHRSSDTKPAFHPYMDGEEGGNPGFKSPPTAQNKLVGCGLEFIGKYFARKHYSSVNSYYQKPIFLFLLNHYFPSLYRNRYCTYKILITGSPMWEQGI
jgi:hypothetical protein